MHSGAVHGTLWYDCGINGCWIALHFLHLIPLLLSMDMANYELITVDMVSSG